VGHVLQRRPLPARPSSSYITSPQFYCYILLHYILYTASPLNAPKAASQMAKKRLSQFFTLPKSVHYHQYWHYTVRRVDSHRRIVESI